MWQVVNLGRQLRLSLASSCTILPLHRLKRCIHPLDYVTQILNLTILADCAVCADGYTQGLSYSCRECSGDIKRSAVGLTIAVALTAFVVAGLSLAELGAVVGDGSAVGTEAARRPCVQKYWSCQSFLVENLPLTAIKIVVIVWQILSQVGERPAPVVLVCFISVYVYPRADFGALYKTIDISYLVGRKG